MAGGLAVGAGTDPAALTDELEDAQREGAAAAAAWLRGEPVPELRAFRLLREEEAAHIAQARRGVEALGPEERRAALRALLRGAGVAPVASGV